MASVTVAGAHDQRVTLPFDHSANLKLGQQLAAAITAGVQDLSIRPAVDTDGPPPPLLAGKTGEFLQTKNGLTVLPPGYKAFVDDARESVVLGSGDNDESVLSGIGQMTFIATNGSGTVAAGGGDNRIIIPASDAGAWSINTGGGSDTIAALGGGNQTVNSGGGHDIIALGSGNNLVNSAGAATVFGGTGSDTFQGGRGNSVVHGGIGSNNLLAAGSGPSTLFGGGSGDTLIAGSGHSVLQAGSGNETLIGGRGDDTFAFNNGQAGGADSIQGFAHHHDKVDLQAYGKDAVKDALKSQLISGSSDTITLSDNTSITFVGLTHLTKSDFITNGNDHGHHDK